MAITIEILKHMLRRVEHGSDYNRYHSSKKLDWTFYLAKLIYIITEEARTVPYVCSCKLEYFRVSTYKKHLSECEFDFNVRLLSRRNFLYRIRR